jgi:DNA repair protein RecO (recombination protein O)
MPQQSDTAIILRRIEFSETSQIVAVFGRASGQLRLIAKGARRGTRTRFAAGLDLLEFGELGYSPAREGAELGTLTDWRQRDAFTSLRASLPALHAALYAAELTSALTEVGDPHEGLFDGLVALLNALAGGEPAGTTLVAFIRLLMREVGYMPELSVCVDCRRPVRGHLAFFSSRAGGVICRDCEMHHVEKRQLPALLLARPATADPVGWLELLDYHASHLMGRRPATSEPLFGALRAAQRAGPR